MSSDKQINLNGKLIALSWIRDNCADLAAFDFSANEARALVFIGKWLAGQDEFVMQTSGSTGDPKAITLTRKQMVHSAIMTGEVLGLRKGDRAFACLSTEHIAGTMMLVRALELGLELTIVEPRRNPFAGFAKKKPAAQIGAFDFAAFVPLQLQTVLTLDSTYDFVDKMKAILVGGAPISDALRTAVQRLNAPVYQTFGMTETVSHIALRRLNGANASEAYQTLPGVEIKLDERGCLMVKAPVTNNVWMVTNDLVQINSEESFVWLGRYDNVINSGGTKVSAEKVEGMIAEVLGRADGDFFVCGLPDSVLGEAVTAVFEGNDFYAARQDWLLDKLSQKLPKYELPKTVEFVDSFVRTATGKIDRKKTIKKLAAKG